MIAQRMRRGGAGLLVLLTVAAGCGTSPTDPVTQQEVQVVLTDQSGSDADLQPAMEVAVRSALTAAAAVDGKVVVIAISGDSAGNPLGAVVVDFRGERPAQRPRNDLLDSQFRSSKIEEGHARYQDWQARHTDRRGSDYAGGLRQAADVLADGGGAGRLTVVGDGFSNGPLTTGRRGDTSGTCQQTAQHGVQTGLLPSLTGVPVRWIGGGHTKKPNAVVQADLRACWQTILTTEEAVLEPGWWQASTFR